MITTATARECRQALDKLNDMFDGNIKMTLGQQGKKTSYTLSTIDHKGNGSKRSASGRVTNSACWHVHGYMIDLLLDENKDIVIWAGRNLKARKIYMKDGCTVGNWQDWNCGSIREPVMMSECCDC